MPFFSTVFINGLFLAAFPSTKDLVREVSDRMQDRFTPTGNEEDGKYL
jgi:hypothetical protein